MEISSFDDLVAEVKKKNSNHRAVVVSAQDESTMAAIVQARRDHLIEPILIGNPEEMQTVLSGMRVEPGSFEVVPAFTNRESLSKAIQMIREGQADILMRGRIEAAEMARAVAREESLLKPGGILSLMGLYRVNSYHKMLAISDIGLNIAPDLKTKKQILENAVQVLHALGIERPKVAVLSAMEKENPGIRATVDGKRLKEMNLNNEITGCEVEGPISFDLSVSKEAAVLKNCSSTVAGEADLLLVPDLVCGNVLTKCMAEFALAQTAGLAIGAKIPIVLTSRVAKAADKYYSIALAAYISQNT
jgi:phosphate butyryltransferase